MSLPPAFTLAWLTERTDLPGRRLLYTLMFVPMLMPSFAVALGWILLLGPNAGAINVFLREALALDTSRGPLNIYTLWGMVFVSGVIAVPAMWLLLLGLFRNLDSRLEEAAATSGAGRWQVLKRVTVPRHWKYLALAGVIVYFLLAVILPTLVLVWASLLRFYVPFSPNNFHLVSLRNYRLIFGRDDFATALQNTLITAGVAATVSMLLAALIAWYLVRRPGLLVRVLGVISFMPLAVPNVIIALALLLLYTGTPLYDTLAIMILAFVTRYLAFTIRVMHVVQLQIDKVLEEAALVAGAGRVLTFVKINLRVLLPALLNGWLWVVAHAVRDFAVEKSTLRQSGRSRCVGVA